MLQQRTKHFDIQKCIKKGSVVLLINQRPTRLSSPIARVQEVILSRDGLVRSCWLKLPCDGKQVLDKGDRTKKQRQPKLIKRGIEELCLLEEDKGEELGSSNEELNEATISEQSSFDSTSNNL